MRKELIIVVDEELLRVRSRPASWMSGGVLILFLGGLLWLVGHSMTGEGITRVEVLRLSGFAVIGVVVIGFLIFMAIGHRELIADRKGLVYSAKLISIPVWWRRIAWRDVKVIKNLYVEGASGEGGYNTLLIQLARRKYRLFVLSTAGEELTEVVSLLKGIQARD